MNYYEHHLGDWDADTAHLSMLEDAAYSRLVRYCYRKERPVPADISETCRQIRAQSKDERKAVESVLAEFFELRADGWHQSRCDKEIEAYQRKAERNREVGKMGGRPKKTKTQDEPTENHGGFSAEPKQNPHQTPDTSNQTPDTSQTHTPSASPTDCGRVCLLLKVAGIGDVNPGHPDLAALLQSGATDAEFIGAAQSAVTKGKGFVYALGIVKRQRQEAKSMAGTLHTGPMPTLKRAPSAAEQRVLSACPSIAAPHLRAVPPTTAEVFDVTPHALG